MRPTSKGATGTGHTMPASSWLASMMAAGSRDTPMPYEPICTATMLPSDPCTRHPMGSEYLVPKKKIWPISTPRADTRLSCGTSRSKRA